MSNFIFLKRKSFSFSLSTARNFSFFKGIFLLLVFSFGVTSFYGEVKKTSLELYADSDFNVGEKLKTSLLDASLYLNYEDFVKDKNEEIKNAYGISIFSGNILKNFPCKLSLGKLTYGGSLSKINNPLISSWSSPFSFSNLSLTCVTSSLPGSSSYSKPSGIFFELGFLSKNLSIQKFILNCWAKENEESEGFSLLTVFSRPINGQPLTLSLESTMGLFSYEEKLSSKWFPGENFHKNEKRLCMNFQTSVKYKSFSLSLLDNVYQDCFNNFLSLFRSDFKISLKHFSLILDFLYSPEDKIETPSAKKITRQIQGASSIQYKTLIRGNLLKVALSGESFYYFQNLKDGSFFKNDSDLFSQWRICIGAIFSNSFISSSFNSVVYGKCPLPPFFTIEENYLINEVSESEFEKKVMKTSELSGISLQSKTSLNFEKISPSISLQFSSLPKENFSLFTNTYKISLNMAMGKKSKVLSSSSYTLKTKDKKASSQKFQTSLSASFRVKEVILKGKVSFETEVGF